MGAGADELLLREVPSVFAASGFEQPASDAPSSVSVITAADIERFGWRTLAEALGSLRGFHTSSDLAYEYLGVRGMLRPGDWNGRILLLVDGQRVNESIYGQASLGHDAMVDLGSVERIEVVRGPGSSLYGASALFAVVDVTTRRGRDYQGWQAEVRAGSQGTRAVRLGGGHRDADLEYAFTLSALDSDGVRGMRLPQLAAITLTNGHSAGADGLRSHQLQGSVRWKGWRLQAGSQYWHKQLGTGAYGTTLSDPRNFYTQQQQYLRAGHEIEAWQGALLRLSGSVNRYRYTGDYVSREGGTTNLDVAEGVWSRAGMVLDQRLDGRTRLILGADVQRNLRIRQFNHDAEAVYLDDLHRSSEFGLFAQVEHAFTPELRINAGLRRDQFSTFGSATSPRLGLMWRPVERHAFKLLQGMAFRAPNAFELWYGDGGATQLPNPGLQPERMRSIEAVWEASWNERWQTGLSVYRNVLHGIIDAGIEPASGLLRYANQSGIHTTGVEAQLDARLGAGVETRLSLSWQDSRAHTMSTALSNSPHLLAKGAIVVRLGDAGATLALESRSVSSVLTLAGERLPGYTVVNATLNLPAGTSGWRSAVSVFNALDRHYVQPVGQEHAPQTWLPQAGRMVLLRLEKSL
ncbi:TonB-dependent receptor plug domain-containing protein [Azohydromonas aeria]|uniref:TonB-dependent receptor plug domain-containing protein n=1 Tax=Azohydromonas aeria TaxID=2590212 RepID=UPI0012F801BC|nr:TonB-dependent receptor [Azohydromonas aeria]